MLEKRFDKKIGSLYGYSVIKFTNKAFIRSADRFYKSVNMHDANFADLYKIAEFRYDFTEYLINVKLSHVEKFFCNRLYFVNMFIDDVEKHILNMIEFKDKVKILFKKMYLDASKITYLICLLDSLILNMKIINLIGQKISFDIFSFSVSIYHERTNMFNDFKSLFEYHMANFSKLISDLRRLKKLLLTRMDLEQRRY